MCACLMMLIGIIFVIFLVFIAAEKSNGPKIFTNIKEPPKTKKPEFTPPAQGKEKVNLKKD